ncbi:MAG: response regulator [Acidobacteria bacterium]|nr:response regulator [Acidobacteriota bacterium]
MKQLRALVVDDEEPARQRLIELLTDADRWEVARAVDHGAAAIDAIRADQPDVAFLDVQMPEMTGFEVVREVGVENMCPVVFVTAYDQYALQAFETFAIDYLLKPFSDERFQQALGRCEDNLRLAHLDELHTRMGELIDSFGAAAMPQVASPADPEARIPVQSGDRTLLLPIRDVDYVAADGPYMHLHVGEHDFLIRERMQNLERRLAAHRFQRIHRSTLVNLERVVAIEPYFRGEAFVLLRNKVRLKVSRSRRRALYGAVGGSRVDAARSFPLRSHS